MMARDGGYISYPECGSMGELHLAPASYGNGGRGARIAFTIADTTLGRILIAAAEAGVCWLGIHEDEAYLEEQLRGDYPRAAVGRDDNAAGDFARQMIAYMNGAALMLPLDIRATPFQAAVWRELCAIPSGTTRSYGEIARRLGRPNASRAVGHANGSNPVAIAIPCHRAIGSSGALTGYRWGIEYKRRLLEHEAGTLRQSAALARSGESGAAWHSRSGI
jgi:AraC family transcriptional regulator of adaptative response/methylated-DNA-[protein]-cysteine methyltransferase